MNCSFCATGQMGFLRNLRAGEIIEQVVWVARALHASDAAKPTAEKAPSSAPASDNERLSNLVLMGMGEPFANYNNVMEAVRRLTGGLGKTAICPLPLPLLVAPPG